LKFWNSLWSTLANFSAFKAFKSVFTHSSRESWKCLR